MLADLVKVLAAAITGSETQQALVVAELRRLNDNVERIWPKKVATTPLPDEPVLGDDPLALSMAEDARTVLHSELGRDPSVEEVLERVKIWTERRDPIRARGTTGGYGG